MYILLVLVTFTVSPFCTSSMVKAKRALLSFTTTQRSIAAAGICSIPNTPVIFEASIFDTVIVTSFVPSKEPLPVAPPARLILRAVANFVALNTFLALSAVLLTLPRPIFSFEIEI